MSSPAKHRWLRFSLATLMIATAVVAFGVHWGLCVYRANKAASRVDETLARYDAGTVLEIDVIQAFYESLEADLEVPLGSKRAAYETHLRRLAKMRLNAEGLIFPSTGAFRPMVVFTTHYELALRKLAKVAGEGYAESIDQEFDFPYRDQFDGHPAAVRAL